MSDLFESGRRITDPDECAGLTVARVKTMDVWLLAVFTDGRFLLAKSVKTYGDVEIVYAEPVSVAIAHYLGLLSGEEFAAARAAEEAERKAFAERREREQYERLRAKYGDGGVTGK